MKKNFFYSTITTISRIVSGILIIFILARIFSLNDFGIYTYALVVANIVVTFVEYGYNTRLIKKLGNKSVNIGIYTTQTILLKLFIFTILLILIIIYLNINYFTWIEKQTIFYIILALVINSFIIHLIIPYKIIDRFDLESKYAIINNLTTFIVICLVAYITKDVVYTSMSFFIIRMFILIYLMMEFHKKFLFKFRAFDVRYELKKATPYAMMTIIGGMYLSADTIIMKYFLTMEDIGIYRAGINIILASAIITNIINNVALPKLSSYYQNREQLLYYSTIFNRYTILIGIVISLTIYSIKELVVYTLYGNDFNRLISYMPYIISILFLRYLGSIYGLLLTIADKQLLRVICVTFTLVVIVGIDFILIPKIGLEGGFIGMLVGHILLILLYISFSFKEYNTLLLLKDKR